jgi:hypothetical protein
MEPGYREGGACFIRSIWGAILARISGSIPCMAFSIDAYGVILFSSVFLAGISLLCEPQPAENTARGINNRTFVKRNMDEAPGIRKKTPNNTSAQLSGCETIVELLPAGTAQALITVRGS